MAVPFPPSHHTAAAWLTYLMSAGWQSTPVVNIFKQCDVENKKDCVLSGKVGLRMVRVLSSAAPNHAMVPASPALATNLPAAAPLLTGRGHPQEGVQDRGVHTCRQLPQDPKGQAAGADWPLPVPAGGMVSRAGCWPTAAAAPSLSDVGCVLCRLSLLPTPPCSRCTQSC